MMISATIMSEKGGIGCDARVRADAVLVVMELPEGHVEGAKAVLRLRGYDDAVCVAETVDMIEARVQLALGCPRSC